MKKLRNILIALILLTYLGMTIGFISEKRGKVICNSVKVVIPDSLEHRFIRSKDVMSLIQINGQNWIGEYASDINTKEVESLIYRHPAVKKADVYKTVGGSLKIEVMQRQPLLRVINRYGESYYIDEDGKAMPWSSRFTARVMVANGNISNRFDFPRERETSILADTGSVYKTLRDLYKLALFIRDEKFWKAHIEQVYVEENGDFDLVPRVGGHLIIFGLLENMEEKFSNLRLIYEVGLPNEGWNNYSSINLKYKDQVVCTKK